MRLTTTNRVSPRATGPTRSSLASYVNRGTIGGVMLGSLAALACRAVYRQLRSKDKRLEKVVEVQRWEGEGGNLAPPPVKPAGPSVAP